MSKSQEMLITTIIIFLFPCTGLYSKDIVCKDPELCTWQNLL